MPEKISPEEDANLTRWRLFLLNEEKKRIEEKIKWETEAFYLRNSKNSVE